jgi:hypothetical protein
LVSFQKNGSRHWIPGRPHHRNDPSFQEFPSHQAFEKLKLGSAKKSKSLFPTTSPPPHSFWFVVAEVDGIHCTDAPPGPLVVLNRRRLAAVGDVVRNMEVPGRLAVNPKESPIGCPAGHFGAFSSPSNRSVLPNVGGEAANPRIEFRDPTTNPPVVDSDKEQGKSKKCPLTLISPNFLKHIHTKGTFRKSKNILHCDLFWFS